MKQPQAT